MKDIEKDQPIIFFDGVCGLCSNTVDFFIAHDKKALLKYSPLQGKKARELLGSGYDFTDLNTVVFLDGDHAIHKKSSAILWALVSLGGIWKLFGIFLLIPRVFRDCLYDLVAKNRYKWFGKKETCRLPTPEERVRFFD